MGPRSWVKMDSRKGKGSIFGHSNRLMAPHGGKFRQVHAFFKRKDDRLRKLKPLLHKQNFGRQLGRTHLHVVPGDLLEP